MTFSVKPFRRCRGPVLGSLAAMLSLAAAPAVVLAAEGAASEHADHSGHEMTPEQFAMLRARIKQYETMSDEQIVAAMTRMMPDSDAYLSASSVRDSVGVLGLGHGYAGDGNDQFKAGFATVALRHPTAVGLGMVMMDSANIQNAVSELEAAGARTIVVLPSEVGHASSLVRQWEYIFSLREESAYLDVPRVRATAKIVMAQTPTTSPLVGRILADHIKSVSTDPAKEVALLITHGDTDPQVNAEEMENLAQKAPIVRQMTGIAVVHWETLQDDSPPAIRKANVERIRGWIAAQSAAGKTVLVAPVLMTAGGVVTRKIRRDLDGLSYTLADKGIIAHPLFNQWVTETVAAEARKSG
jgi:hypothetical protein